MCIRHEKVYAMANAFSAAIFESRKNGEFMVGFVGFYDSADWLAKKQIKKINFPKW